MGSQDRGAVRSWEGRGPTRVGQGPGPVPPGSSFRRRKLSICREKSRDTELTGASASPESPSRGSSSSGWSAMMMTLSAGSGWAGG